MIKSKAIVTGGAGFIGSHLVIKLLAEGWEVLNIDKLTYSANLEYLKEASDNDAYSFKKLDICDRIELTSAILKFSPDVIFHLAAESHVDRSISDAAPFVMSNIVGTYSLLEACRHLEEVEKKKNFKFIHISTDEVYGSLQLNESPFREDSPFLPNSPYAASKASSDHLVRAWGKTYELPVIITHSSNNYGPHQHSEKLIPKIISNVRVRARIPIYGDGSQIRDWMHVSDHVEGLLRVATRGVPGETYNFGGGNELTNLQIAKNVCKWLDVFSKSKESSESLIENVADRQGHDFRYSIDTSFARKRLGWRAVVPLEQGIKSTVEWYLKSR